MRIAFFVNSIEGEHPRYTTTALALAALARGHDICYLTPGDFVLRPDDSLLVRARTLPGTAYKKVETLYQALQGDDGRDRDHRCPRDRRADAAQRSLAGRGRAALGGERRPDVRPAGGRPRRAGAERSRRPRPRPEQALPPGVSPGRPPGQPDLEEHRGDPRLHRRAAGRRDPEAAAGLGRQERVQDRLQRRLEPEPDLRGGLGRGLPGRAKLHSGGGGRRRPPLRDERRAASARRQVRRHASGPGRAGSIARTCTPAAPRRR